MIDCACDYCKKLPATELFEYEGEAFYFCAGCFEFALDEIENDRLHLNNLVGTNL